MREHVRGKGEPQQRGSFSVVLHSGSRPSVEVVRMYILVFPMTLGQWDFREGPNSYFLVGYFTECSCVVVERERESVESCAWLGSMFSGVVVYGELEMKHSSKTIGDETSRVRGLSCRMVEFYWGCDLLGLNPLVCIRNFSCDSWGKQVVLGPCVVFWWNTR